MNTKKLDHVILDKLSAIKFYRVTDEYGEFSNFAEYPITLNGKRWLTSEHYFQAMKFESKSDQIEIHKAKNAFEAAIKGRSRKRKIKKNWESIKCTIMKDALLAKFTQHNELRILLLSTANRKIIEHTKNDSYWGDGDNGKGRNMLGKLLMEVRVTLSSNPTK